MSFKLSIVIPIFNEAAFIKENLHLILLAAACQDFDVELIAVDDGSSDDTSSEILHAAENDPRIKPLLFTRNFGKEAAIHAGLRFAKGDCAIVMDSDLQHPPDLIPEMLDHWRKGSVVVECVKSERGEETALSRIQANLFYSVFYRLSGVNLDKHSDFKLLDRVVIDAYLALPERKRFFRGLIAWTGYQSKEIPFTVPSRADGGSRWSKIKLIYYAIDNITGFSTIPLHAITLLGVLTLIFGLLIAVLSLYQKINGSALDGFTTVNLLLVMIGGVLMVALGIIGNYLARIYEEIKGRPTYILKKQGGARDQ